MKKRYVLIVCTALLTLLLSGCPAFIDFFGGGGDDDDQDDQVPDLVFEVIDFSVDAATGAVSGVDFTIENGGGADVVDADYHLALSTNAVIDSNDTVVYEGQISVVAGGQKTISLSDEIGDYIFDNGIAVPVADYYAGLLLDPGNDIAELDETNNNGASANTQLVGDDSSGGGGGDGVYTDSVTISGLSSIEGVTGGSSPGSATAVSTWVQYADFVNSSNNQRFYNYSIVPGAPYEFVADDDFVGSGYYSGDIDITLGHLDQVSSNYITSVGAIEPFDGSTPYHFDSPFPGGTESDSGVFTAPAAYNQIVRIRPFTGSADYYGSFGFGLIQSGGYGFADLGYASNAISVSNGSFSTTVEEQIYSVGVEGDQGGSAGFYMPAPASEDRFVRFWIDDDFNGSGSYNRNIQVAFEYSEDGESYSAVSGLVTAADDASSSTLLDSTYAAPGVFRIPPGATDLQFLVELYNGGAVPDGTNAFAFAYDYY